jgi:hypothetical protein
MKRLALNCLREGCSLGINHAALLARARGNVQLVSSSCSSQVCSFGSPPSPAILEKAVRARFDPKAPIVN